MYNKFVTFKLNESKSNSDFVEIANNNSYWSWEYDSIKIDAKILFDKDTNDLYLDIKKTQTKTGIGSVKNTIKLEFLNIGNIYKPNLGIVRTLLKKHSLNSSVSSSTFSRFWEDIEGNKLSLSDLIKLYIIDNNINDNSNDDNKKTTKKLKHIKDINTFDKKLDIKIVKYSDRSYAIFGVDTKKIKEELKEIGCRYNKFLTDPDTGNKKPGWVCSISKIEKLKKLIN